jgi:hypothetical protein
MIEYDRLLQIARKMHLYIFLNTGDEQKVYDELGITDEENIILGYSGQFKIKEKKNNEKNISGAVADTNVGKRKNIHEKGV